MDRSPQRVEIVVPVRTLMVILMFGALVVLAVLSLGTLLSIFLAAVVALGLDPVVGALVKRGWKRGTASLVVFAGVFIAGFTLVLVTAGPLWDEIKAFMADNLRATASPAERQVAEGARAWRLTPRGSAGVAGGCGAPQ